jgi:hypothetical protein
VGFGHLVEDLHPVARAGRAAERKLDAAHAVLDVDEGAGLAAGAVDGERVVDRRLDQEAVQHGAVVAVVVEAVDELRVAAGLVGVGAPDDALVQVGDPQAVVLGVELEEDLIEALGHVVDRAGARRVEDLLRDLGAIGCRDVDVEVAFGDRGPTLE